MSFFRVNVTGGILQQKENAKFVEYLCKSIAEKMKMRDF